MTRASSYSPDLRNRLIRAAAERLATQGPEHMSLRDLAASVDTSTNAIYALFGGKDQLIDQVVLLVGREHVARAQAIVAQEATLETLHAMAAAYREWARTHPALYRLMFSGCGGRGASYIVGQDMLRPLRHLVAGLHDAGILLTDSVDLTTMSLWASVHGFVLLELNLLASDPDRAQELFDLHIRQCVRGLAAPHLVGGGVQ